MRKCLAPLTLALFFVAGCGSSSSDSVAPPPQPAVQSPAPPQARGEAEETRLREVAAAFDALKQTSLDDSAVSWNDWIDRRLIYKWSDADRNNLALLHYLEQLSRSPEPVTAYHALFSLAKLGHGEVFDRLVETMQSHPNGYIRGYAARGLGHLQESAARVFLTEALEDSFAPMKGDVRIPFVRECARAALLELP